MRIDNEIKLDFSDVLIRPKRSTLVSRANVDLTRKYTLRNSKIIVEGVPIIAANMFVTGTVGVAKVLGTEFNMFTALHKFYTTDQLTHFFTDNQSINANVFVSMGIGEHELESFNNLYHKLIDTNLPVPRFVCIDVANGYTETFVSFVERVREMFPAIGIMAGNVVSGEMTEALLLAGADIVKVGIGSGCLTADSRVLMSNGCYKNISDVQSGDEIITMLGTRAKVKRSFMTGYRKVRTIRNAHFHAPLQLTSDHQCFVGDLSSVSTRTLQSRGYNHVLSCPTRTGETKLKWLPVNQFAKVSGLMPRTIDFNLPTSLSIDISEFFKRSGFDGDYNKRIESSYNLGYLFGTFLGDGHAHLDDNFSGRVEWYFHIKEQHIIEKVNQTIESVVGKSANVCSHTGQNFMTLTLYSKQWAALLAKFGTKTSKHLPSEYMCLDQQYLKGLYDGLMDSDGHYSKDADRLTNTSPQIIELFQFISLTLWGGCANVNKPQMLSSYKVKAVNETFTTFVPNTLNKRFVDQYQAIKLLDVSDETNVEVPVYDLEIDDNTHSFIANNMIVHNSVCTTRKVAGVGYPQLSAVIECADAAHGLGGHICSDGGIAMTGDVAKAFGAGADFVMCGGVFAGHAECEGIVETTERGETMKFYGMSSDYAMEQHYGRKAAYRASEGKVVEVPYKGPISLTVEELLGGLRSACTYVGAWRLKDLSKRTTFVRVNRTHNTIFGA